jgi:hypothetical protein
VETMQRKRCNGRFAKESGGEEKTEPAMGSPAAVGAPRARHCRAYARRRLAEAAPELMEVFLKKAKGGSVQHLKTLMELTGIMKDPVVPAVKKKRRGKSMSALLQEEMGK